ncbi:Protein SSUH2-like protein ssu-2-like protein [Larimichthys crocea]|uniref:Protein SSUH2-like protein ssu-2-like protein n=1 Tax=Larimichthys crocea TaxID=215358 RepID=A0A6G0J620_LARCR|nr:Protein SSUH2-like protein ssu-2-like protein [Larimichthys crocea]
MDNKDEVHDAFDPNIPEEGPSAPPPGWLDDIHGYLGHRGGEGDNPLYPPPPAYNPQPELNRNTLVPNINVPTISEDVARDALLKFVESKWRYSSKPARNLTFRELKPITVFRYRLETYTETRTSGWQFEPFRGQMVDGPQYGASPPPWDVPVSLPQRYTDRVDKVVVPHSSFVKVCHKCNGCGRTRCVGCHGRGMKRCTFCHGHGHRRNSRCTSCHGRGRKKCISCHGHGYKTCTVCHGSQNLLHFIQLTVTWKNNIEVFIPDRQPEFPDQKFETVTGNPLFVDESVLVYPLQGFPDQEICSVSSKLINEHFSRFSSTSRILHQRQTIEVVPLTHAYYMYGGKNYSFFVYGTENKIFTNKYPSACSIL